MHIDKLYCITLVLETYEHTRIYHYYTIILVLGGEGEGVRDLP